MGSRTSCIVFFFNDTSTTEIYTLSLHDALPILGVLLAGLAGLLFSPIAARLRGIYLGVASLSLVFIGQHVLNSWTSDRKSTRLNSSHANISYAVFCLKKTTSMLNRLGLASDTT